MHVAFTYDQNAEALYFNGLAVTTNLIGPRVPLNSGSRLRISGDDNDNVFFDGWIDDVRLYGRALSAEDICRLFAGSGGECQASDVSLALEAVPQPAVVGSPLVYTLSVRNDGPHPVSNVVLTDRLPDAGQQVTETDEDNNRFVAAQALEIRALDLAVSLLTAAPAAQFGQSLPVTWVVRNDGTAAAEAAWSDGLYFSRQSNAVAGATALLSAAAPATLAPDAAYTNTQAVTLPLDAALAPGTYYLVAATDASSAQSEADEQNNLRSLPMLMTLPPLPDLAVTDLTAPALVLPGQPLEVVWTVTNRGAATLAGSWRERLSVSNALQGFRTLGEFTFTNTLGAAECAGRTQQCALPLDTLAGPLWFFVNADSRTEVMEEEETNNLGVGDGSSAVPALLTLTVSALQVVEGAPAFVATVHRNSDRTVPLAVTLSNADPTELDFTNEVVIPVNWASASVAVRAVSDGVVDGPR